MIEQLAGVAILAIPNDTLVATNLGDFKQQMEDLLQNGKKVVVDLENVQFIDSAGCGVLLTFSRRLKDLGGDLKVCNISKSVRALFELVRIQRALSISSSRDEAIQALLSA